MGAKLNAFPLPTARPEFDPDALDAHERRELVALAAQAARQRDEQASLFPLGDEPHEPSRGRARARAAKLWGLTRLKLGDIVPRYARAGNGRGGTDGLPALMTPRCAKLVVHVLASVDLTTGEYHSTREKTRDALNYRDETTMRRAAREAEELGLLERIGCRHSRFSFRAPAALRTVDAWADFLYAAARRKALGGEASKPAATIPTAVEILCEIGPAASLAPLDPIPESAPPAAAPTLIRPNPRPDPGRRARARDEMCSRPQPGRGRAVPAPEPSPPGRRGASTGFNSRWGRQATGEHVGGTAVPAPPARPSTPPPAAGARRESRGDESTGHAPPPRPVAASPLPERRTSTAPPVDASRGRPAPPRGGGDAADALARMRELLDGPDVPASMAHMRAPSLFPPPVAAATPVATSPPLDAPHGPGGAPTCSRGEDLLARRGSSAPPEAPDGPGGPSFPELALTDDERAEAARGEARLAELRAQLAADRARARELAARRRGAS